MRIAVIGCGNMGSAFAEQLAIKHQLRLYDSKVATTQKLAQKLGGEAFPQCSEAIQGAQLILLAIKPEQFKKWALEMGKHLRSDQILVSILAGTPLSVLRSSLDKPILVRMMPNLAIRFSKGVMGFVDSPELTTELKNQLEDIFIAFGLVYWLQEKYIDGLTALAGSGPAFMLMLIEAMVEAGVAMGFSSKDSQALILQMMEGSIALLNETGKHPGDLKWQIASPGGVTIAGIRALEQANVRSGLMETFLAAYQRSQDMAASHH